jgi:hypothetical protein
MRKSLGLIAAALALAPTGGGSLQASPPPNGGTISIELQAADGSPDASMRPFVDAASAALTAKGFTVFDDPDHAASVVELIVSRDDVGTGLAKVPGQSAASVAGTGVAIPLSTGESQVVRLQRTRLEMRIRKRGEAGLVWDGVAVTVRALGMKKGTDEIIASDLSRALLQSYPIEPTDIVGVP